MRLKNVRMFLDQAKKDRQAGFTNSAALLMAVDAMAVWAQSLDSNHEATHDVELATEKCPDCCSIMEDWMSNVLSRIKRKAPCHGDWLIQNLETSQPPKPGHVRFWCSCGRLDLDVHPRNIEESDMAIAMHWKPAETATPIEHTVSFKRSDAMDAIDRELMDHGYLKKEIPSGAIVDAILAVSKKHDTPIDVPVIAFPTTTTADAVIEGCAYICASFPTVPGTQLAEKLRTLKGQMSIPSFITASADELLEAAATELDVEADRYEKNYKEHAVAGGLSPWEMLRKAAKWTRALKGRAALTSPGVTAFKLSDEIKFRAVQAANNKFSETFRYAGYPEGTLGAMRDAVYAALDAAFSPEKL